MEFHQQGNWGICIQCNFTAHDTWDINFSFVKGFTFIDTKWSSNTTLNFLKVNLQ